jgi:thermostable 8-oxoguanine DNA glycosylase
MNFEDVFSTKHQTKISSYEEYWKSISPTNSNEIFRRWLFAYTSIHSTWQSNVRSYNHIKNFEQWKNDKSKLAELLFLSKSGLHNQRTENIWDFKNKFFDNPDSFIKSSSETWVDLRNRLAQNLKGIGLAKVSFALELCYPNNVEIVCLDVHMLRALKMNEQGYRADSKKEIAEYMTGENVWLEKSKRIETSPYITRCLYWDILQGHKNSRYWSSCLESQLCLEI